MGELSQDRPEGAITLAGFARALLARTFIIPWCHPGPCGQARCGLKARHIDPRNSVQEFDSTAKGERQWLCFPGGLSRTESLQRGLRGYPEIWIGKNIALLDS